jgi:class 3 adenylate cyclase
MIKCQTRQLAVCPDVLVMVLDISRSTDMFRDMGERAACELIAETVDVANAEIQAFGGEVSCFVGDGLLATWRLAPTAAPVSCVISLWRRLAAGSLATIAGPDTPVMHGSLHFGSVTICTIGSGRAVMLGQALNIASRLDDLSHQVPGGFLVSHKAAAVLSRSEQAHLCDAGRVSIRGARETLQVMCLHEHNIRTHSSMERRPSDATLMRSSHIAADSGPTAL